MLPNSGRHSLLCLFGQSVHILQNPRFNLTWRVCNLGLRLRVTQIAVLCSIEVCSTPTKAISKQPSMIDVWVDCGGHVGVMSHWSNDHRSMAAEAQQIKDAPPLAATGLDSAVAAHGVWKRLLCLDRMQNFQCHSPWSG